MSEPANPVVHADFDLDRLFSYRLSVLSNRISGAISREYHRRFGLAITEWRVMAVLGDAEVSSGHGAGPMTQRGLTAATLMDKVAVNRAVKVLEDRGLIARVPNPEDGRSHLLALTGEGRAIHAEVMPLARATEAELLADLEPGEEQALRRLLGSLRKRAMQLASQTQQGPEQG